MSSYKYNCNFENLFVGCKTYTYFLNLTSLYLFLFLIIQLLQDSTITASTEKADLLLHQSMGEGFFQDYINSVFIPSSRTTKTCQVSANVIKSISSWGSE